MNKYHQEILEEIQKVEATNPKNGGYFDLQKYMGTPKSIYNISNFQTREIVKGWVKKHQDIPLDELLILLDSLFTGQSHNERSIGGKFLDYLPNQRCQINPLYLDKWLTGAQGWGEVDSLCQSSFNAKEILANWKEWEKLLTKLVKDSDIHKRRASLVLLTKPAKQSDDSRLVKIAFENIEKLKEERDILITKAISWLLRDLIKNHKDQVANYLDQNSATLPKIAIRETKRKLLTGKK
ncbi:MAG: DNA alkylation repair protein [Candidatus Daviesbacteria bacterium]|nr:DNA alkylation repair protein [Candidatus Daviesbacteria bacterium]